MNSRSIASTLTRTNVLREGLQVTPEASTGLLLDVLVKASRPRTDDSLSFRRFLPRRRVRLGCDHINGKNGLACITRVADCRSTSRCARCRAAGDPRPDRRHDAVLSKYHSIKPT